MFEDKNLTPVFLFLRTIQKLNQSRPNLAKLTSPGLLFLNFVVRFYLFYIFLLLATQSFAAGPHMNKQVSRIYQSAIAEAQPNWTWKYTTKDKKTIHGFRQNYFKGKIGPYIIFMDLQMLATKMDGFYFYEKIGHRISLEGQIGSNREFVLREYDKNSEFLKGKFNSTFDKAEGVWTNNKNKQLPFKLERLAEYRLFLKDASSLIKEPADIDSYDIDIEYPFFIIDNPSVDKEINPIIADSIQKDILAEFIKYFNLRGDQLFRYYEVKYVSQKVLSVLFDTRVDFSSDDGRHPSIIYSGLNLKIAGNAVSALNISDLFKTGSDYKKIITDFCAEEIKKRRYEIKPGSLAQLDIDSLQFTITQNELELHLDSNKFATGGVPLKIPFDFLKHIINPDIL